MLGTYYTRISGGFLNKELQHIMYAWWVTFFMRVISNCLLHRLRVTFCMWVTNYYILIELLWLSFYLRIWAPLDSFCILTILANFHFKVNKFRNIEAFMRKFSRKISALNKMLCWSESARALFAQLEIVQLEITQW